MAEKTKYLKALENLRDTYQRTSNVSLEGRGLCLLHLFADFAVAYKHFSQLEDVETLEFDTAYDVDLRKWKIRTEWTKNDNDEEENIEDLWTMPADVTDDDEENPYTAFLKEAHIDAEEDGDFVKRLMDRMKIEQSDVNKLEQIRFRLIGTMCDKLKSVDRAWDNLNDSNYSDFGAGMQSKYLQGKFYGNVDRELREQLKRQYRAGEVSEDRCKDLLKQELNNIYESDFLDYMGVQNINEENNHMSELIDNEGNNEKFDKFRYLVNFNTETYDIELEYGNIGWYVFVNSVDLYKDDENKVEVFFRSLVRMKVFVARMRAIREQQKAEEQRVEEQHRELSHDDIRNLVNFLVGRLNWENLYKEGYNQEMVQRVFDKFLVDECEGDYREVPYSIWTGFTNLKVKNRREYLSMKYFVVVLGFLDSIFFADVKMVRSNLEEYVFRGNYENCGDLGIRLKEYPVETLGDYLSAGRGVFEKMDKGETLKKDYFKNNRKWPNGEQGYDISLKVYLYLKEIMKEVAKEVENENKQNAMLEKYS